MDHREALVASLRQEIDAYRTALMYVLNPPIVVRQVAWCHRCGAQVMEDDDAAEASTHESETA